MAILESTALAIIIQLAAMKNTKRWTMDSLFIAYGIAAAFLGLFCIAGGLVYLFAGEDMRKDMRGE